MKRLLRTFLDAAQAIARPPAAPSTTLDREAPKGRLDVAAFRAAQLAASQLCPAEWPVLAPHVEQLCRQHLGPRRHR
ncbi:MAG TPA: hypothetical protein DEH78_33345 [Solibacterales bacterium]|nr:hypothetical protein [Bryobacterales bacterium]